MDTILCQSSSWGWGQKSSRLKAHLVHLIDMPNPNTPLQPSHSNTDFPFPLLNMTRAGHCCCFSAWVREQRFNSISHQIKDFCENRCLSVVCEKCVEGGNPCCVHTRGWGFQGGVCPAFITLQGGFFPSFLIGWVIRRLQAHTSSAIDMGCFPSANHRWVYLHILCPEALKCSLVHDLLTCAGCYTCVTVNSFLLFFC